jgi:hypothetical protein
MGRGGSSSARRSGVDRSRSSSWVSSLAVPSAKDAHFDCYCCS